MLATVKKVRKWGRERHIDNFYPQFGKVVEEMGELVSEVNHGSRNPNAIQDAIGDTLVTLIILADILGYDIEDCLEVAWKEIKDRKGHTDGGMFIKEK